MREGGGGGGVKEGEDIQPNPIAATPLKSTQSAVCAAEQMAGLVAVKTMGRVSTHGLSQHIHTHSNTHTPRHIPVVHFTHMVNKNFIILMGLQWGKLTQVTPSGRFIHHIADRCISAAGTTSGLLGH